MKRLLRILLYVLLVFFVIILFGNIFVGLLLSKGIEKSSSTSDDSDITGEKREYSYKYFHFDPKTGETSTDLTTISKYLQKNEFISFQDSEGGFNLISNLESTPYFCSGTCYCENTEENDRRNIPVSSTILKKGIGFLLSALSVTSAIHLAEKHFRDECKSLYFQSSSCETDIISRIDDCSPFVLSSQELQSDDTVKEVEDYDDDSPPKRTHRYICEGHCVWDKSTSKNDPNRIYPPKEIETACKEMELKDYQDSQIAWVEDINAVRKEFIEEKLDYFCSRENQFRNDRAKKRNLEDYIELECTGFNTNKENGDMENDSVTCVSLEGHILMCPDIFTM